MRAVARLEGHVPHLHETEFEGLPVQTPRMGIPKYLTGTCLSKMTFSTINKSMLTLVTQTLHANKTHVVASNRVLLTRVVLLKIKSRGYKLML